MPREIKKPNGAATKSKHPMGIPPWGWVVAIALGLVVGYLMIRNKNANASNSSSDQSGGTNPLSSSGDSGGGAVASPSPDKSPLVSTLTDPGTVSQGGGDSSTSTNPTSPPPTIDTQPSIFPQNPLTPVSSGHVPGSIDSYSGGVASHPQALAQTSTLPNYVAPNYAALPANPGVNAHRPGFQL